VNVVVPEFEIDQEIGQDLKDKIYGSQVVGAKNIDLKSKKNLLGNLEKQVK